MARAYSQDLRGRLIDAVESEGMSCRGAARRFGVGESTAVKWLRRFRSTGARTPVGTGGHRPSALKPHQAFLEAVRAERPDITLEALGARLLAERGVKADTSMLSRFFRREGITLKKRRSSPANATAPTSAATGRAGANINGRSIPPTSSSSTKPGPKPT